MTFMIAEVLLPLLLTWAAPARTQNARLPSFERQATLGPAAALTPVADLLDEFKSSSDRVRQREILEQIALRAGSLTWDEELAVVAGLRAVADSTLQPPQVRGKALDALGRAGAAFKNSDAAREAAMVLSQAALLDHPVDPAGAALKLYGLMGLSKAAGRLPWADLVTEQTVVLTGLEGLRRATDAQERTLSLLILHNYIEARGLGLLARSPDILRAFEAQVLAPLEKDLELHYADPRSTIDYRYHLIRTLHRAWMSHEAPVDLRLRARRLIERMALTEPDARLRQIASLYAGRRRLVP